MSLTTNIHRMRFSLKVGRLSTVGALAVSALVGVAGLGAGQSPAEAATGSGSVTVLSAGSLQTLMQSDVAPAFLSATGYTLNDISEGSTAIASSIKAGTQVGDVFISASPAVNATLEGSANGDWVLWYGTFGQSPLLLGYNPKSSFAHALKTEPWYDVVGQPGFRLGRTDPTTDPKGVLAVNALTAAAKKYKKPALLAQTTSTTDVYSETSLLGELQAGQLDAGFFYGVEVAAAGLKTTVPITGVPKQEAAYTITILNKAPDEAAAIAFVKFLLGKKGQEILKQNGIAPVVPPQVTGKAYVPATLKGTL
jgi:molybdate/tungstate transport system substrate-binding protein